MAGWMQSRELEMIYRSLLWCEKYIEARTLLVFIEGEDGMHHVE